MFEAACADPDKSAPARAAGSGRAAAPKTLEELFSVQCEHKIAQSACDECRYELGLVKLDPALVRSAENARGLLVVEAAQKRHPDSHSLVYALADARILAGMPAEAGAASSPGRGSSVVTVPENGAGRSPDSQIKAGDRLKARTAPDRLDEAIFSRSNNDRVRVLMQMLGGWREVELPAEALEPVE